MAKKKPSKKNVRPAPVVAMPGSDRLERDIEAGSVPAPYVPVPAPVKGPLVEIPPEDAAAFGVSTTPVVITPVGNQPGTTPPPGNQPGTTPPPENNKQAEIEALAYEAAGYSGDAKTADYIRRVVANQGDGSGTVEQRIAALKRLIEEGKARLAAGGNNGNDGKGNGNSGNSGSDGSGSGKTTWEPAKDAKNTIKAVLATYGLGGLADYLYDLYAAQKVDINRPDALLFALRDQDIYKKRFAANALRTAPNRKGGQLFELDPASYIGLENAYRQLMRSNNLPTDLFDETKDFTDLIAGDVSPQELQDRIQNGFRAVEDADPEVKRQMQQLYGVDEAGLAAYFLNPERAAPILVRRAKAAKVAARAKEQAGMQLGQLTAEEIITRGISQEEAETAFTQLGLMKGLYTEMTGEETLTEQQKLGAVLGYDVTATKSLAQRQATRKAPFQGGGSFARTTGKTSGVTETGLAVAE